MLTCSGLFCPIDYFSPWAEHFCCAYRVIRFDYRSHGQSSDYPDPHSVTLDALVQDASLVLQTMCDRPTILVGHSMGARIACELCVRFADRIKAIVMLCGSIFDGLGNASSLSPLQKLLDKLSRAPNRWLNVAEAMKNSRIVPTMVAQAGFAVGGMSRSLTPKCHVDSLMQHLQRLDIRVMSALAKSYFDHDARSLLPDIKVPVLYVVGENDSFCTVSHGERVVQLLPDARLCVMSDCSHLALVEKPDELHRSVDTFLQQL